MKITVKLLLGPERAFEVSPSLKVGDLKYKVERDFKVAISNQKMLYNGRPLLDSEKTLADYNVEEGGKITVFLPRAATDPPRPSCSSSAPSLSSSPSSENQTLHAALINAFKQFYSLSDSIKVADAFMRDFEIKIAMMSLDDIERLAGQYLLTNTLNPTE